MRSTKAVATDSAAEPESEGLLSPTKSIVAAYVSNNQVPAAELSSLIKSVHATLSGLGRNAAGGISLTTQKPAVPVKKSIFPDYIICLEDGKKLKTLKRYLRSRYGLSPDDYRRKWGLPIDYPMVAPSYSARRSAFAKKIGLGRSAGAKKKRR
ncbi:MAG TPA: MucR family transcriptional regulator [Rhizomicrobium sp.]|jgi:predicted transcriptional regulator